MKPWHPFKASFMPIDFYNDDDARTLTEQGRRFLHACAFIDHVIIGMIKK